MNRAEKRRQEKLAKKAATRDSPPLHASSIEQTLQLAVQHHTSGHLQEAEGLYKRVLQTDSNQPVALHLLGVLAHQAGRSEVGVELISKAITIKSDYDEAHNNLGLALQSLNRLDEAVHSFKKAIALKPEYFEAFGNLGVVLHSQGKLDEATHAYDRAIDINPNYFKAYNNLGMALKEKGDFDRAAESYKKALTINPDYPEAHNNLGNLALEQGQLEQAANSFKTALSLNPDYADAHNNLGNVFKQMGEADKAALNYREAIALKPVYGDAYNNLGGVLMVAGMAAEAIATYQQAIAIDPDNAEYQNNLGNAFKDTGEIARSIAAYNEALRIDPEFDAATLNLMYQLRQVCEWPGVEFLEAKVRDITRQALNNETDITLNPFASVTSNDDGQENLDVAGAASRRISRQMSGIDTNFVLVGQRADKPKITIGYLSSDFQHHATAHLMQSLFELHDRRKFNIFSFSHGKNDASPYRAKIKRDSDKFFDIQSANHLDAAKLINEFGVDILVDLKGHTGNNRLEICALRPAPIQVSYLGFPGSTGADFIDYFITDRVVTPPDQEPFFNEELVYMPHCYQINDFKQKISDLGVSRGDVGLPEDGFVYCSFNGSFKIEPVMFDVWMKLLKKTPDSVLWLYRSNAIVEENLKREAQARGVDGDRLIFANSLPKDEHLARCALADLALDTRICGGHTTTSDALWAGVPVVTLQGNHFASRVSSSILNAIGLPELITQDLEDYKTLAMKLATNPDQLKNLKSKLAKNRKKEPLFDTPRFVANLENAYQKMWDVYQSGHLPAVINIAEE